MTTTPAIEPLIGFTVGIASARRTDESGAALEDESAYAEAVAVLKQRGAEVVAVSVAETELPVPSRPLAKLVQGVVDGTVDGLAFVSPGAVVNTLHAADVLGIGREFRAALTSRVVVAGMGAVTAAPLNAAAIAAVTPEHPSLDQLVGAVVEQVPAQRGRRFRAAGHEFDVRSQAAIVDGRLIPLPATALVLLVALAKDPGRVVMRGKLMTLLHGGEVSGHAVDVAIGRLRTALGDPAVISTVVKRGYRLAVD